MNVEKLHIVFLTPGFAISEEDSNTIPALQVYLKNLLITVPEAKLTLVAFQFPFTRKNYTWNGIEIVPLNGKNNRFKKLWIWKSALKTLKKIHKKHPISTIHSLWIGECSFIGKKFSNKHNISHIVTVMGQDTIANNRYNKSLLKSKAKIITLSINHQKELYKNHNLDSQIIPWSLDVNSFPELLENKINIIGVGSLNTIKNYFTFINIISFLVKDYPKLKVEIIGEGKLQQELLAVIQQKKLDQTIKLIGKLSRQEVLKKMSQSHILLHTSTYESFGYVFSEALYSGMKVVSFDVGTATNIKEWKICKDKSEMISQCNHILAHPKTKKQRVLLHPPEETIASYLKLYNA
ncbi:glycosyltransferase [uncultured Aquimarina sp.]|uniref:glycosyltransferase n=1 Tax=uncultured Aquimarina sp. TaxID=575652 RepID=UPI0026074C66|nr:glycosyltransferase [uncultured Aquimarina sp.]